jgi:hypothetical protein
LKLPGDRFLSLSKPVLTLPNCEELDSSVPDKIGRSSLDLKGNPKHTNSTFEKEVLEEQFVELSEINSIDDETKETKSVFSEKPTFLSLMTGESKKPEGGMAKMDYFLEAPLNFSSYEAADLATCEKFQQELLQSIASLEQKFIELKDSTLDDWNLVADDAR